MRGLTHFVSGMAMATFFPELVNDLLMGNLLPIVAAASAYLPDYLDFKFRRIVEKWDYEIDPAPLDPRRNVSPKTIRVKDIVVERDQFKWYAFKVLVKEIVEEDGEEYHLVYGRIRRSVLKVIGEGGGEIKVYLINEDRELFKKIYGINDLKEIVGKTIRLIGYVDKNVDNETIIVFSDAPHPKGIADTIAKAVDEGYRKGEVRVKLHNIRLPGDVFRRYAVFIPPNSNYVEVYIGPIVTLGGNPIVKELPPKYRFSAKSYFRSSVRKTYPFPTVVSGFSGPSIAYRRTGKVVEEVFIPWHRGFSHSFTGGVVIGLLTMALFSLIGYAHAIALGIAAMLGQWMHVIEDQLGYMGSVLFPPITKKRIPGLMLGRAGSGWLNFATMYLMFVLMAWNFARYVPGITHNLGITDPNIVLYIGIIPSIITYIIGIARGWRERRIYKKILEKYGEVAPLEELEEELGGL